MNKEEKDIKRNVQRAVLIDKVKKFQKQAKHREDKLVLVEDGKETSNEYPYWAIHEDAKSPEEWVGSIMFHWELTGMKKELTMKFVPYNG